MAQSVIQHAFHTGEWSPQLFARVDLQKYHSAAALLRNFYVDYRGGVSSRPGTRYINRCFSSSMPVRLIPFQPTSTTSYVLEFGDGYIRFHSNGAPILEPAITVTGISGNTVTATNTYSPGDWVFIGGAYFIVLTAGGSSFTVSDLWGNSSVTPVGTTAARVYTLTSPFAATDLFPNPLTGNPGIKFVQEVQSMIICHPSYQPQILTINAPASWTISTINFGPTIVAPTISSLVTTLTAAANNWNYSYTVTAVDSNNQESPAATPATLIGYQDLNAVGGSGTGTTGNTNTLNWNVVPGAVSYNVYKASPIFNVTFPTGTPFGFIGNTQATSFNDATPGIGADFSQSPPIFENPFQGAGVQSYSVSASGAPYTVVPGVTIGAPPAGGTQATAQASLGATSFTGSGGHVRTNGNDPLGSILLYPNGVTTKITARSFAGAANGSYLWTGIGDVLVNPGSITGAGTAIPTNPVSASGCSVGGFQNFNGNPPARTFTWGVTQVNVVQAGTEYATPPPTVTFSAGSAAATANLASQAGGNPSCPGFLQERLALAGLVKSPMSFNLSQPASFFNYNISNPVQPDDAISGTIFSGELNDIKSLTPVPTGMLVMSGRLAWIINGGGGLSAYNPITPANAVANPQTFTGANDLPPLKINQDLLYVTNKGSYVRDLNYNIYANVFTGQDISVLSNHLFFGHYLVQWAWAEEPFKIVWAVREDGTLLSLAYVKDQEIIGWAHHDTNGQFQSVCTVLETVNGNTVDAVYVVVRRTINGQIVQYVERLSDRYFTYGKEDSWSVDAALQTIPQVTNPTALTVTGDASAVGNTVTLADAATVPFTAGMVGWVVRMGGGIYTITSFTSTSQVTAMVARAPTLINLYNGTAFASPEGYGIWQPVTTVSGLSQLIGQSVTGVADGAVVSGTVGSNGTLTLSSPASKITLGLAFTPQLQTLPLDLGEPTVQGKPKQISFVSVRVAETLGLSIGAKFSTIVPMKESQLGNQNYYLNAPVTDLINADTRTKIDSTWDIPGQYCIQQNLPYPVSILGVIPEFAATQRQG